MASLARLITVLAAGLVLVGCGGGTGAPKASVAPALTIEKVEGSDLAKLTLSERAVQRLAIETAPVAQRSVGTSTSLAIPYAAVLYAPDGKTWTYTSPADRVFMRAPIVVDRIDGDTALLKDGPAAGTVVVTVGSAELYGAERGVGGGH